MAENRSEKARLIMKKLHFVIIFFCVVIARIVKEFPTRLQTPSNDITTAMIVYKTKSCNIEYRFSHADRQM